MKSLNFLCCYINNADALIALISHALTQIDCPWFPEKHGKSYCTSSTNFAGIYNLHETAEICCRKQFDGNVDSCVQSSVADVKAQKELVREKTRRPRYYWPDLHGKVSCLASELLPCDT